MNLSSKIQNIHSLIETVFDGDIKLTIYFSIIHFLEIDVT